MKRKSLLMLLPGLAMIMAGCGNEPQKPADNNNQQQQEDAEVSPTAMKLKETSKDMKAGDEWELEIEWTPSNTTKDGAIYESSDPTVARISPDGLITALKPGWSDITVKSTANTQLSYSAKVLVLPNDLTHAGTQADPFTAAEAASIAELIKDKKDSASKYFVEGIVKNVVSLDASKGATIDLDAGNGKVFEIYQLKGPEGAVYGGVDVVPGDKVVVNAEIKKYGTTLETGDGEIVSVQKIPTEYVKAQATMSLKIEATGQISPIYRGTPESITYASDAEAVATVSTEGLVTAVAVGKANITVTANYAGGGTATWALQVIVLPETVHAGTEADPFDLADACSYADSLPDNGKTDDAYYIKGVVTKMASKAGDAAKYGNLSWWFESGEFAFECYQVFAGPELEAGQGLQKFTSDDDIQVGDEVTVCTPFTKYVSKSGSVTLETVQKLGYVTNISRLKATEIKSVKSKPEQVEIGTDVNSLLEKFTIVVGFNNGQPDAEKNPTSIELDTSVANENATAVLHYGDLTINCAVKVTAIPPIMEDAAYYLGCKVAEGEIHYVGAPSVEKTSPKAFENMYDAQEIRAIPVEGKKDVYKLAVEGANPKKYLYISDLSSNSSVTFDNTDEAIAFEWKAVRKDDGTFTLQHDYMDGTNAKSRFLEYYASNEQFRSYVSADTNPSKFVLEDAVLPTELKVVDAPTDAYVGEELNLNGKVKATFGGVDQEVSNIKISPNNYNEAEATGKVLTITFKGLTTTITVDVKTRTLTGIEITGDMTTKTYGELDTAWDFSGLTITGSYEGGATDTNFDVSKVTFTADKTPAEVLEEGDGKLTVTAKVNGNETITDDIEITGITVTPVPHNIDELTYETLGLTGSYSEFSKTNFLSGATYKGKAQKGDSNTIQINNAEKGIYTSGSNRLIKSITFVVGSAKTSTKNAMVYAKRGEFANTQDVAGLTEVKKFTAGTGTYTYEFPNGSNYNNICIRADGAVYFESITIVWDESFIGNVVDEVVLDKTEASVAEGETLQLNATLKGLGTLGDITWESSDESIATVSDTGIVEGVAAGGPVTITAKSVLDSTKSATCAVTVTAARSFTELTTTGSFKVSYTSSETAFAIDSLKVFANYSSGDPEEVTNYTVTWSSAFDATVGDHTSTPTIHWDGHDLQLTEVAYNVSAPASIEVELTTTTLTVPTGMAGTAKTAIDKTGTASICGSSIYFERVTYNPPSKEGGTNGYFMFRNKKDADRYGASDSAGKGFLANTVATSKAIARIEIDVTSGASTSAAYGVVVGNSAITSFAPTAAYTSSTGNNQTFAFDITEANMTFFAVGCTTTGYNGQISAIRVYTK